MCVWVFFYWENKSQFYAVFLIMRVRCVLIGEMPESQTKKKISWPKPRWFVFGFVFAKEWSNEWL
jgi:hypothetical protein